MVSPMLVGEQREIWQKLCTGASDVSTIGSGRSLPKRIKDSAQRAGHTWPKWSPVFQCSGTTRSNAILYPLTPMPSMPTCPVRMDRIVAASCINRIKHYGLTMSMDHWYRWFVPEAWIIVLLNCLAHSLDRTPTLMSTQQTVAAILPLHYYSWPLYGVMWFQNSMV